MTLIVAVEAANCFVMAADSLTTMNGKVVSCDTQKLHQVSRTHIAAGAGRALVGTRYWSQVIPSFLNQWAGPCLMHTVAQLRSFLDAEIATVDPKNHGACAGGNTFLVAGPDPTNSGMNIWVIERIRDQRQFLPERLAQRTFPPARVWWIGDTQKIQPHIASTAALYMPGMSEQQAVAFAVRAIVGGTSVARSAHATTIGGGHIYVAVAAANGVTFSRHASGVPCP